MNMKLIDSAIESYRSVLDSNDVARLEFYRGLWELQNRHSLLVGENVGYDIPSQEEVLSWYWNEKPLFLMAPVSVDKERFRAALEDCSCYLVDHAGLRDELSDALRFFDWRSLVEASAIEKAGYDPIAFIDECSSLAEEQSGDLTLPYETAVLVISFALRPMLQEAASQALGSVASVITDENNSHSKPVNCPACGDRATAAFVGETPSSQGNGRLLYCATCGTSWEIERIRCAHCGTNNQGHLHYFHVEGDDAHRLYSCDECGGYTRTVFQADAKAPFVFEVEDVVMARLDLVAQDERFKPEKTQEG